MVNWKLFGTVGRWIGGVTLTAGGLYSLYWVGSLIVEDSRRSDRLYQKNIDNNIAGSNQFIEAVVEEEIYENKLRKVREFNGVIAFSNETVTLDSTYVLRVITSDGRRVGISIEDGPNTKKESLDILISNGTRILFPSGNIERTSFPPGYKKIEGETDFRSKEVQAGSKRADRIKVIGD